MRGLWALAVVWGCKGEDTDVPAIDADGDGSPAGVDCNDSDANAFPGAPERCDGVDQDCDASTDDAGAVHVEGGPAGVDLPSVLALAGPGAVVVLCPGTYGPVTIADVTLRGGEGVTIDAAGVGSAIVASGAVALEGLVLTGGVGSDAGDYEPAGGGLNAWSATSLALTNVRITGNSAEFGGGLALGPGTSASLEDTRIEGNTAEHGGGLYAQTANLTCARTAFVGNEASGNGGGMSIRDQTLVTGCEVSGNHAEDGGGIGVIGEELELAGMVVSGNTASRYGGGLYTIDEAGLELTGVTVQSNQSGEHGGALFAGEGTSIAVTASAFTDNDAGGEGGGAYLWNSFLEGDAQLQGNAAVGLGGGIATFEGSVITGLTLAQNTADLGAGLALRGPVELDALLVQGNEALTYGGGIYAQESVILADTVLVLDNVAVERGGGLFLRESSITGVDSLAVGNEAAFGGGLYASSTGSSSVTSFEISQNQASDTGGGVFTLGALTLVDVAVDGNTSADRAGGLYAEGAAAVVVASGTVDANEAVAYGGGIYVASGADVTFSGSIDGNLSERGAGAYLNGTGSRLVLQTCVVSGNGDAATDSGGGVRISEGTLEVTNTTFTDNLPDDVYTLGPPASWDWGASESFVCTEAGC
jgi:predicted outer membrane repeat protein